MQYNHLGRTGLQVSQLALGTMNFGMTTDEDTSFEILDKALEAGINLIDTADVYGGPQSPDMEQGYGVSEEIIGPRTVEQLTGSLRALEISLSDEELQRLDEIWPGPGGEAPKAYAW